MGGRKVTAVALAVGFALGLALPVTLACTADDTPAPVVTVAPVEDAPVVPDVAPTVAPRAVDTVAASPVTVPPAPVAPVAPVKPSAPTPTVKAPAVHDWDTGTLECGKHAGVAIDVDADGNHWAYCEPALSDQGVR